jgi:hypothetical protein
MVKMAPHESFVKVPQERVRDIKGEDGGKIKWKSSEVNTRTVSRVQNKLIGEFKMAAGEVN